MFEVRAGVSSQIHTGLSRYAPFSPVARSNPTTSIRFGLPIQACRFPTATQD